MFSLNIGNTESRPTNEWGLLSGDWPGECVWPPGASWRELVRYQQSQHFVCRSSTKWRESPGPLSCSLVVAQSRAQKRHRNKNLMHACIYNIRNRTSSCIDCGALSPSSFFWSALAYSRPPSPSPCISLSHSIIFVRQKFARAGGCGTGSGRLASSLQPDSAYWVLDFSQ